MPQRVSVVTLGVADLGRSRRFYEAWGWTARSALADVVFFQCNGLVLGLYGIDDLAVDQGRPGAALGTGAIALAQNYPSEAEVDRVFEAALAAGGTMLKRPQAAEWGGYSGYVADPDGHPWELAVNPFWDLEADGSVTIPTDAAEAGE